MKKHWRLFRIHKHTDSSDPCDLGNPNYFGWHLDDSQGNLIACKPTWDEAMTRAHFFAYGSSK